MTLAVEKKNRAKIEAQERSAAGQRNKSNLRRGGPATAVPTDLPHGAAGVNGHHCADHGASDEGEGKLVIVREVSERSATPFRDRLTPLARVEQPPT